MDTAIAEQFDELGLEVSPESIAKCVELCINYDIDNAEEFCVQWVAFSVSKFNTADPTVEYLQEFERKILQSKRDKELAISRKKPKATTNAMSSLLHSAPAEASPLAIYGVQGNDEDFDMDGDIDAAPNSEVLGSYNVQCNTPKAKGSLARTSAGRNGALFSPASYSPIGTPRSHAIPATGSGKIVYTFGNSALIRDAQWSSLNQAKIQIQQLLLHNGEPLGAANSSKYMFDHLREKAEIAGDRIFQIGRELCRTVFGADAEEYVLSQVDAHSQDAIKTIGTICCDCDGRLDESSTLLIGSNEMRCRTVHLDFSKAKSVAIFPGQIVMVSGMNPRGDKFMVEEIISERELEPPALPKFAEQLSFVLAAGPYTNDDDLIYDPLQNLLAYCKENSPDVLILTGPFLEADHKLILENTILAETFESLFEKIIISIVDAIGSSTTILIVSSHKDVNSDPVYPTMPLSLKKNYSNVHFLPDPSLIDLNGITIGMTSTDIVDHLISNELAFNSIDKVKRVVNYLLHQASFYPLNPPPEDEMCLDSSLLIKYANIDRVPNILILPSNQKCFIRVVNGCLVINPGRVADKLGGTFARFIIRPPAEDEGNIFNYVGCQVRKV